MIEVKVLVKENALKKFELKAEKCDLSDKVNFRIGDISFGIVDYYFKGEMIDIINFLEDLGYTDSQIIRILKGLL